MSDANDQGFARFFADSREALSRYVRRLVKSRGAAEDIVQEAYFRTYGRTEAYHAMRPYLFTVARNLAANVRRHDRVVETLAHKTAQDPVASPLTGSPEEVALAEERIRLLKEAIQALPPQCRAAFTLRMFQECSYKEIAAQLGITAKTVEKHIALGTTAVHAILAKRFKD